MTSRSSRSIEVIVEQTQPLMAAFPTTCLAGAVLTPQLMRAVQGRHVGQGETFAFALGFTLALQLAEELGAASAAFLMCVDRASQGKA